MITGWWCWRCVCLYSALTWYRVCVLPSTLAVLPITVSIFSWVDEDSGSRDVLTHDFGVWFVDLFLQLLLLRSPVTSVISKFVHPFFKITIIFTAPINTLQMLIYISQGWILTLPVQFWESTTQPLFLLLPSWLYSWRRLDKLTCFRLGWIKCSSYLLTLLQPPISLEISQYLPCCENHILWILFHHEFNILIEYN